MSMVQLGEAHLLAGRVEEAGDFGTRAVVLARERGERGHQAWAHRLLGETASHRDGPDVAAAEAHYATSTALALELGMRPLLAHCHFSSAAPRASRRWAGDGTSHDGDETISRDGHAVLVRAGRGRDAGSSSQRYPERLFPRPRLTVP